MCAWLDELASTVAASTRLSLDDEHNSWQIHPLLHYVVLSRYTEVIHSSCIVSEVKFSRT